MSVIWVKVWYDLWNNKLRILLVVVSIAAGVFAIGTTFGLVNQMIPAMDFAHHQTNPSHVTMFFTQPVSRNIINELKKVPGVVSVEPLNSIEIRYKKQSQDKWGKGSILMRDDFENQFYDVVQLKSGDWPIDEYLNIERMHAPFYGIEIGDHVIIEVNGQEREFQISGKIRHPFVPPPSMYDWAWFFSGDEVMELFNIPAGSFNQFKFQVTPYSETYAKTVASAIKDRLSKQGITVASTLYQDPEKHWGRAFIDGMTLVIQVLAIVSLLLSVVLVLNTLTAIITQQTSQIGILKAIGSSSFNVIKVYLAGVIIYGLLALLISLPLGAIASFNITRWFLGLYNIDYEVFRLSYTVLGYQIIAAILVPIGAACLPIFHGAALTVRQAISSYGIGADFGSGVLDQKVEHLSQHFLISYYAMSLVNTFRRKGRLILTQLVLIIAGVMFLVVMSLSSSMKATLDAEFGRRTHDVIMNFEDLQRVDRTVRLADSVPGVDKADLWLVIPVTILHKGQKALDAGMGSQLQGVPVEEPMYKPLIVEGRWLLPGDQRVIVMNKETADRENIRVGDTVTLDRGDYRSENWQVVGLYRVFLFFGGGYSIDAIYAPREVVYEVTNKVGKANILLVRTSEHSVDKTALIAGELDQLYQKNQMNIWQIETMPALRRTSDTSFAMVISMLLVLAFIVALVGAIGLTGALWISVIERTKEIGVMRAIGAQSSTIMRMFMLEGALQGLMSWLAAVPISFVFAPIMSNALGITMFKSELEFQFNFQAVVIWLIVILLIALVSSIIPARNATRVNVRQSLTYE